MEIKYPQISEIESAIFIQPHPDDNEIGAGGLMAHLVAQGKKVYVVTITTGSGGSNTYTPQELAEIRHQEALRAAEIIGVEYLGNLGFGNDEEYSAEDICRKLVPVLRQYQPQTLITCDPDLPNEMHPAHIKTGNAVKEAFLLRTSQAYYPFNQHESDARAYSPQILGMYFTADDNSYLNIEQYMDIKRRAVNAHQSQSPQELLSVVEFMAGVASTNREGNYGERFKLLRKIHAHCFAMPKEFDLNTLLENMKKGLD